MRLHMKKENIINFIFLFILSIIVYYIGSKIIDFCFILFLLIIIVRKAKISFFSILTFILVFTLFQEFMFDIFRISTGMLLTGLEANNYFNELYLCTNIFCMLEYLFINATNIVENEKKIYLMNISITNFWTMFFSVVSLIITLLIFPSMPTFKTTLINRFNSGILPFSGFAGLVFLLIGITYDSGKKIKFIYIIDFFVVFWFVGHGERVEALGILVYIFLKYLNQNSLGLNNIFQIIKKHFKLVILVFILIGFLIWIGITRSHDYTNDTSVGYILSRIFIQSTASDVAYIFNCSVDLWKNGNLLNGSTYLSYISEFIPFGMNISTSEKAIREYYYTVGGCPFFAEIIMNFGIIGVLPLGTLFLAVYSFILSKVSIFRAIFWIPIVIEIFRTAWYGWTGWFTLSFWVTPVIYLLVTRIRIVANYSKQPNYN